MKHLTVLVATALVATVRCATLAHALTAEEIALLNRADRQKILEEGAKKEGKLVWYTPLIVNQAVRPLKEAFEKKYPFIKVDFHRANSRGLVQKWIRGKCSQASTKPMWSAAAK